jgi:4-hydroxybenzoate polyprenyltransferase
MAARRGNTTEGRDTDRKDVRVIREPDRTRGGLSPLGVITGLLVAFGAFVVLTALIGGILAATGVAEGGISAQEATEAGTAAGIGLVLAQFLAYLWGGYTAGRMARGSGILNGVLVPIVAIVLVAILGALVAGIADQTTDLRPEQIQQLPLPLGSLSDLGSIVGIALLLAMLVAGALGGAMGQRWHTKLEKRHS